VEKGVVVLVDKAGDIVLDVPSKVTDAKVNIAAAARSGRVLLEAGVARVALAHRVHVRQEGAVSAVATLVPERKEANRKIRKEKKKIILKERPQK
jgi:hypothetical protein